MNRIIFLGHIGSDAPGWYIGADGKLHRFPGWNPEQLHDLQNAIAAIKAVGHIKTPAVEKIGAALHELISSQLGSHLEKGDVLVLG